MMDTQTTETGFSAETMNIHAGNVAGNDIHIYHENNVIELEGFSEINTLVYSDEHYMSPSFTDALYVRLTERRLIVIAGGNGFDKNTFIRHLASRLRLEHTHMPVKEWRESESSADALKAIRETEQPSILIINQVVPQRVGYRLDELATLAQQYNHFLLLSSDMTADGWQQSEVVLRLYWFEIPAGNLYTVQQIEKLVVDKIKRNLLLFELDVTADISASTRLTATYTPAVIAQKISSAQQLNLFFDILKTSPAETLDTKISHALNDIIDSSESLVTKWFRTLSTGDKLVVLGAAMLEGLFDDQYFAVMQRIVENFWRYREEKLQSLDYCDLDFMMGYFKFEQFGDGRQILESRSQNQRAEILKAAWLGHKRHILSAFTVLTELAGTSSASFVKKPEDRDINGTRERGKRLRAVTAETISDIGIVSLHTAEPKLYELASSRDDTIRRVTAKAIARWREFRKTEQLYVTLERWANQKSRAVKQTILMTLRYVAEFDSPENLDLRITGILVSLSHEPELVAPLSDLLSWLMERHFFQISNIIRNNFAVNYLYVETVSSSMRLLYINEPFRIKPIIEAWLNECLQEPSRDNRRQQFTQRDNLLVMILSLLRSIPYTGSNDAIPLTFVWQLLDQLHSQEQRKNMRSFILETAAFLISSQPAEAIRHIEPVFRKLGISDRMMMIQAIGHVYLQQRRQLEGGEYLVKVNGVEYPSWWHNWRPLTAIEQTLFAWLFGNDSFAREIASLSFMEFVRILDHEERLQLPRVVEETRLRIQNEQIREQQFRQREQAESIVQYPVMPQLGLWTRIKIFFWLLFRSSAEKRIMREVMNTFLMYRQIDPVLIQTLCIRWNAQPQDIAKRLAWWLKKISG